MKLVEPNFSLSFFLPFFFAGCGWIDGSWPLKKKRNRNCWGEDEEAKIKSLVKSGMDLLRQLTHSQACLQIRQQTFFLSGFSKGSFLHGVRKNESLAWSLCPPHSSLKWAGVEGGKKRSVDLMEFKRLRRDQSQSISLLEVFSWPNDDHHHDTLPSPQKREKERRGGREKKKTQTDWIGWLCHSTLFSTHCLTGANTSLPNFFSLGLCKL